MSHTDGDREGIVIALLLDGKGSAIRVGWPSVRGVSREVICWRSRRLASLVRDRLADHRTQICRPPALMSRSRDGRSTLRVV
jgi:hypothetical protein